MTLTVDLLANWKRIGELTTGTFDAVIRHLAPGEWTMSGYVKDVELAAGRTLADVDQIRALDGTTVMFGGIVGPVATGVGGYIITDTPAGREFTLAGPDMWDVLASRIAYPAPTTEPPWAPGHDSRVGVASTVAVGFISDNVGPTALPARRVPGLVISDGYVGPFGWWSGRLQPLDELVARICADGGIVCRPTMTIDGGILITLGSVRDRRTIRVLSDQCDLTAIRQGVQPATATFVVAGGQGQLAARTFATAGTASGLARREAFYDVSALATAAEVQQAATSKLGQSAEMRVVQAQLVDYAATRWTFLTDYDVGDLITVELDGVRYGVPVSAVSLHRDAERTVIKPVLGGKVLNELQGLISDVAGLQVRSNNQIA